MGFQREQEVGKWGSQMKLGMFSYDWKEVLRWAMGKQKTRGALGFVLVLFEDEKSCMF